MGLALYRKYRPKSLAEVVGQDAIITTLQNALATNAISHAYLLTGPRGVGKTSIARILAHEINGLAYNDDSTHLDIIEIDAASNRRIDEIRELRDKIHIAPTSAKYKVYIIDEVHMLTREAFNALLKTLEEPPEHAVFILATTEAHKVPDTIISRTQRFSFKPITTEAAVNHLKAIAKKEKITITEEAIKLLAEHSNGSFRDAINLLDQLSSTTESISADSVRESIGIPNEHLIDSLQHALHTKDASAIIALTQNARTAGVHAATLASRLASSARQSITDGEPLTQQLLSYLQHLSSIPSSASPYMSLELALLGYITTDTALLPEDIKKETKKPASMPAAAAEAVPTRHSSQKPVTLAPTPPTEVPSTGNTAVATDNWQALLQDIKTTHNTVYGILRMAEPLISDDKLILQFRFPFHQKQLSQSKNIEHIATSVRKIFGKDFIVTCVVQSTPITVSKSNPEISKLPEKTHINDISNIFDGAELLE